jgi:RsiW-degrading membrane proteinase PrsW (M82 family)
MGYYIGKGKFSATSTKKWIAFSLFIPFLLHGIYDYILISLKHWIFIMFPFMIFLWWLGLRKVKKARAHSLNHMNNQFDLQKTLHS